MKVLIHSLMIFLGTLIAAALVALGEPAEAPLAGGSGQASPPRSR